MKKTKFNPMDYFKPGTLYESFVLTFLFTIFFTAVDTAVTKSTFNAISMFNPILLWMLVIGVAIVLDWPMTYAAMAKVMYMKGMMDKEQADAICSTAKRVFFGAFGMTLIMRIAFRESIIKLSESGGLRDATQMVAEGTNMAENISILIAAITTGIIPALTTYFLYMLVLFTFDPRKGLQKKRMAIQIGFNQDVIDRKVALAEARTEQKFTTKQLAEEKDRRKLESMRDISNNELIKQALIKETMNRVSTPDSITNLTYDAKAEYASFEANTDSHLNECKLENHITENLINQEGEIENEKEIIPSNSSNSFTYNAA